MPRDDGGRRGHHAGHQSRPVAISKALSRLLRHAAVQERIPIDSHGYVRLDHLLGWQRLKSMQPRPTMHDIVEVVRENEKQRFGLKYQPKAKGDDVVGGRLADVDGREAIVEGVVQTETETEKAIAVWVAGEDGELTHYFIRANQGHSIKDVEAENLLTPVTLDDDEDSIPSTVVHGTFYGAWENILRDGGLRRMGRNHVHFSVGPPLADVMVQREADGNSRRQGSLTQLMAEHKVKSGMRPDAQILVYVDVRKALKEEPGMKWWRSENGVVLTEGVKGVVEVKYWQAAVEVKEGLGLLWEVGHGVVQELPGYLKARAVPLGKRRGGAGVGAGGGRGGREEDKKPRLRVERELEGDL